MSKTDDQEHTFEICDPCRNDESGAAGGHHLECVGTKDRPCSCLVCEGERIGDRVLGDLGGNYVRRQP